MAIKDHRRFLKEHPVWTELSPQAKNGGAALAEASGTYKMRDLLGMQQSGKDCWDRSQ